MPTPLRLPQHRSGQSGSASLHAPPSPPVPSHPIPVPPSPQPLPPSLGLASQPALQPYSLGVHDGNGGRTGAPAYPASADLNDVDLTSPPRASSSRGGSARGSGFAPTHGVMFGPAHGAAAASGLFSVSSASACSGDEGTLGAGTGLAFAGHTQVPSGLPYREPSPLQPQAAGFDPAEAGVAFNGPALYPTGGLGAAGPISGSPRYRQVADPVTPPPGPGRPVRFTNVDGLESASNFM